MKPNFANIFNVSANENRSEIVLSFYQMYVKHNYSPQQKGLIDCPAKEIEDVASILVTREGALALMNLLQKTLGAEEA